MLKLENVLDTMKYVEKIVANEENGVYLRRYYRFRASKHYGGSAVADTVGCMFNCIYCWSWKANHNLGKGFMMKPIDVVKELISIARSRGYNFIRISGGEPTLGFQHLIQVIEAFSRFRERNNVFILETNGLLLGLEKSFVEILKDFRDIVMLRISLKGCSEEEFERITGIEGSVHTYQIKAVENIIDSGFRLRIAVPISFCTRESFSMLLEKLSHIDSSTIYMLDPEIVVLYPSVVKRLCLRDLKPWIAVDPIELKKIMGDEIYELFKKRCREIHYRNPHQIF
ncbi:MAG: radical SAM protein [Ignisphaera sp.]